MCEQAYDQNGVVNVSLLAVEYHQIMCKQADVFYQTGVMNASSRGYCV